MCQPVSGHSFSGGGICACGCCGGGHSRSFRRFFSAKEEEERLENYRDQLKKELAGVEEYLKERKEK